MQIKKKLKLFLGFIIANFSRINFIKLVSFFEFIFKFFNKNPLNQFLFILFVLEMVGFDYFFHKLVLSFILTLIFFLYKYFFDLSRLEEKKKSIFFNKVLCFFYTWSHLYFIWLNLKKHLYKILTIIFYFLKLISINKKNKIIENIFIIIIIFFESVILFFVKFFLSYRENILQKELKEIILWRFERLFLSICMIHWIIKLITENSNLIIIYIIIIYIFLKISYQFYFLIDYQFYTKVTPFFNLDEFWWPNFNSRFYFFYRIKNTCIYFPKIDFNLEKKNSYSNNYNNYLKNTIFFPVNEKYGGICFENYYWYRPDYIYENIYNGLDMLLLQDLNFMFNKVLSFCITLRKLIKILENKKYNEKIKDNTEVEFNSTDWTFCYSNITEEDFNFLKETYELDEIDKKLSNGVKLLMDIKLKLSEIEFINREYIKLNYYIDVKYLTYDKFIIYENTNVFVDINYKKIKGINLKVFNENLYKEVVDLRNRIDLYKIVLVNIDILLWYDNCIKINMNSKEEFKSFDIKKIKSDNINYIKEELKLLNFKKLKIKKEKKILLKNIWIE